MKAEYLAGYFDAAGHISMRLRGDGTQYNAIKFFADESEVLYGFHQRYGGILQAPKKNKMQWALEFHGQNALDFAKIIEPHVIVKSRRLAALMLALEDQIEAERKKEEAEETPHVS